MNKAQIEGIKKRTENWERKVRELSLRPRQENKVNNLKPRRRKFKKKRKFLKFKSYKEYLLTPQWERKRKKVLKRAGGICEECRIMKAKQVHHLNYKRIFFERLSDLKALCGICHASIHNKMSDDAIEKIVSDKMIREFNYQ